MIPRRSLSLFLSSLSSSPSLFCKFLEKKIMRRPSALAALALSLALLLLLQLEAPADAASPPLFWRRSRSLLGGEEKAAASAAPAPWSPPPPSTAAAAPSPSSETAAATTPPPTTATATTALCADDGPEGCGALVIQPPAAKAALKEYVDCVTVDPSAAGEACVREGGNGNGNGNGNGEQGASPSSFSAAKAESDPRDACPEDPLFDDRGEFSAGDWGAVAEKVRRC